MTTSPWARETVRGTDELGLDVDERTRTHPVTQLAQEFGWRLSGEDWPGRPHYIGLNGEQMTALLVFDGEPVAGEHAFSYVMASRDGQNWVLAGDNDLPYEDQIQHLRDYFTNHALAVEGN